MYIYSSTGETMEVKYEKSFFTKISEYQVQVEKTKKGLHKISFQRFTADKDLDDPSEKVNIHPDILNDLIESLIDCRNLLGIKPKLKKNYLPVEKKKEIEKRYLRGVNINDLCTQFDTDPVTIEKILLDAQIEIISKKDSKPTKTFRRYRGNRS